jgi:hypothetical protein
MDNGSVGYGKPPDHSRFRKGVSGNPKGRPKRKKDLATITDKVLGEKVVVTENGRRRSITKLELIIRQLTNKAAQGNMPAVKILQGLLQNHAEMLNAEQSVTRDTPLTLATIDNILSGNVICLGRPKS